MSQSTFFKGAQVIALVCLLTGCNSNLRFDDDQYRPLETPVNPHSERQQWN